MESIEPSPRVRPIHVAFLTGFIPPYQAPVYRALAQQVQRLSLLISTPMEADRQWDADWDGLDVTLQKTWTLRRRQPSTAQRDGPGPVHLPLDTWKQLQSLKPDVVVSEELGFRSLLCVLRVCITQRTPLILVCNVSEHTEQHRGSARRLLRRFLLRNCSAVTAGGFSGERYIKSFGVPQNKLFCFPYAAISKPFLDLALDRATQPTERFVYCGTLNERKGVLPMMRAVVDCATAHPSRQLELTIIGDGPLRKEIETLPTPANLRVHLTGHLGYDAIADVYRTQSVMIFPTMSDEWGLVVNEALAAGLPVCGSVYSQAVLELVDSSNGWKFRPDDPHDFSRVLEDCLSTPPQRLSSMRLSARDAVIDRTATWAANQLLHAIDAVVK